MPKPEPTIFVIDDDEAVRDSLEWLLTAEGIAVQTFASAAAFLDAYRPGRPGCLLLDVRMPGMSGLELQRELTARSIDIPVIVTTGQSDLQTALRVKAAGAVEVMEKPLDGQALVQLVQDAIGG